MKQSHIVPQRNTARSGSGTKADLRLYSTTQTTRTTAVRGLVPVAHFAADRYSRASSCATAVWRLEFALRVSDFSTLGFALWAGCLR